MIILTRRYNLKLIIFVAVQSGTLMMSKNKQQLTKITLSLHWIVGLTIIGLLAVGIYMEENEAYHLYDLHKSVGAIIFIFILARVVWRIRQGWPEPASEYTKIEQQVSKTIHYALLIGSVLIPLSGIVMSVAGGHGLHIFSLELLAANPDPADSYGVIPLNGAIAGAAHGAHGLISNILILSLALHIVGALKHHIMDKDATLKRMLGRTGQDAV
jgi:cytochrome b561